MSKPTPPIDDTNELRKQIFKNWQYSKPANTFRGWWKKSRPSFMQNQMTEAEMKKLLQNIEALLAHITAKAETQARIEELEDFLFNFSSLIVASPRSYINERLATLKAQAQKGEVKS